MTQDTLPDFDEFKAIIDRYRESIPVFAKAVFGYDLTEKQREFCEAFRSQQRITFRGGAGFGKSFSLALLVWWSLICHDHVKVSVFGPSEQQLKTTLWNEIKMFHERMHPMFRGLFTVQETTIKRVVNPASCSAELRLADKTNTARARGIHAENNFVIVDEASGVDDEVFTEALLNIFSDGEGAKLCLVSNPDKASGYFWRTHCDPDICDDWTKIHGTFFDSPKYDPNNPEAFEKAARQRGGPTSKQYRIMILGEFPLSDEDGLIPKDLIDAAVQNKEAAPRITHRSFGVLIRLDRARTRPR
ncbi:AAA family ATPase [Sinorhizobium psoraleae]|uniref:AAA family ATPase n=1 Tax=Sinorhizobium psoraleae TaxID=520838 RepID=A0ABT4KAY8_9HYPH|nr:AAA family ATPase [Sinorhizobium psoraleae]MCZ4089081.1 AAA family ATPase [Sinorhizobium psoraleae]